MVITKKTPHPPTPSALPLPHPRHAKHPLHAPVCVAETTFPRTCSSTPTRSGRAKGSLPKPRSSLSPWLFPSPGGAASHLQSCGPQHNSVSLRRLLLLLRSVGGCVRGWEAVLGVLRGLLSAGLLGCKCGGLK